MSTPIAAADVVASLQFGMAIIMNTAQNAKNWQAGYRS